MERGGSPRHRREAQRGSERARANHSVEPTNRSGGQAHLFVRL